MADRSTVRFVAFRRSLGRAVDAQRLFAALTEGGRRQGSVLLQSSDNIPKYGERSFGVVGASLKVSGRGNAFEIEALDERGRCLIPDLAGRLGDVADQVMRADADRISGTLAADTAPIRSRDRPFRRNHMAVLRLASFAGASDEVRTIPTHGLFGCFAYSFVHQYERFERNGRDVLDDPDYVFYLATRMFIIDHVAGSTHVVSSVPVRRGADLADMLIEAERDARRMIELGAQADGATDESGNASQARSVAAWRLGSFESDTDRETFCRHVDEIRRDIYAGRAFQVVYGRMLGARFSGNPFDVYCRLSEINPSPYMFYVCDGQGALVAASPEMAVRVTNTDAGRRVEIRPIAGTKPRGVVDGRVDALTDAKYETALKIDPKELAEHTMLVDLARNDVSSICQPGTTVVDEPFIVEKYSHVQHLVSNVSGLLRSDLDALHAYLATMNMGTVTGAPKLEAMKMINARETSARGFFGGGVGYFLPDGQMDTALVIRAIRIKDGRAYVRAAAGIVADSVAESEWQETAHKAAACVRVLQEGCVAPC